MLTTVNAQTPNPELIYHERLYHLGKIWGYAKYFHPELIGCNTYWDEVLLEKVALVKQAKDDVSFNEIIMDMLQEAGEVKEATTAAPILETDNLSFNVPSDWFQDPIFDATVLEALENIKTNFRPQSNCKINVAFAGGNPTFENDNYLYEEKGSLPSESERILAIFRYWNIINYFFPYKYQMDQNWDKTLIQFIPPIVSATTEIDFVLNFRELTTYINDSHSFFSNPTFIDWQGRHFAPFAVKMIENQTVITKVDISVEGQIQVGDIVTNIDGLTIDSKREALRKYTAGSNEPTIERNINNQLVRGRQGTFELTIKNEQGEKTIQLKRKSYGDYTTLFTNVAQQAFSKMKSEGGCEVGYINMDLLTKAQVPLMFEAFKALPAIVVDIRNYPQGTLWEMVDYLYDSPINFSAFINPDVRHPGTFGFYQHAIGRGGTDLYKGKLVLLFNEDTQSQAEFTIMGLEKHPGAIKIGSQTAGADGNVSIIELPGGIKTYFSGLGVFYPDGTETQRIGIIPDIEVLPTIAGVRARKDEMLEFALDCELLGLTRLAFTEGDGIQIYPNPTQQQITIQSEYTTAYTITVTDLLGRFVEEFSIGVNNPAFDLNFSDYAKGVYLLSFNDKEGVFATEKLIKL